jgi:hypothetical protein
MRARTKIAAGAAVAALFAMALGRFIVHDWLTVDACYDGGGVYLDEIDKCSQSHAEVDHYRRR